MIDLFLYSLVGGLFSLVGGLILLWKPNLTKKITIPLISFGAGAFLAAALLDILPEALETAAEPRPVLVAVLIGYITFFLLERILMKYLTHSKLNHQHSEHTESLPVLIVTGDIIHNFLDGLIIAFAYLANPILGLPTALAIAAHEIPQEIGDFSVLLHLGWARSKIIIVNIFQSLVTIPGVFVGLFLGQALQQYLPYLLGFTAGMFLYISASDLVPELHHQASHKHIFRVVFPMILGIIVVFRLVLLAHGI